MTSTGKGIGRRDPPAPVATAPTVEQLAPIPLFASLSREELETVAPLFTVRSYAKNSIVSTEGDQVDFYNLILSGEVQAFWRDADGHQLRLGIDGAGMHFHDHALCGQPLVCSHLAIEDLLLASIRMADFKVLLQRHPQVALVLIADVAARLRRLLQRTKMLTMEDVYGRVVKLLHTACVVTDGKLLSEPLTHAEIGQTVGATREMVGRVLRDLTRGGYVRAEHGRIEILRKLPARW